jgi:asparagine synthase (glutamine-hydrolysing)
MRLICGLMRLDGTAASLSLLDWMVAQMDVARLRSARSDFRDGAVAMAVLDFSATRSAPLPIVGAATIAADVRLDEPADLAQCLNLGPNLGAEDQGALLLAAVKHFGTPERALGDFAFAAWDSETETLTCGRDIFGIRPFSYVYKPGELFAFASVPAALHGSGIVPKKIDTNVVVRRTMRAFRFEDSAIEGIVRLPPGHMLTVSRTGISLRRYWQLDRAKVGTARITQEEAAAELRRRVDQAVRSRLPRDARVGAHLSGGLDSSAIAILAARALRVDGRTLHAYSFLDRLRNDLQLEDETDYVKSCLEQEGDIDWEPVRPSTQEFEKGNPADADLMHPLAPENPEIQVATIAERQGVSLILSGWGGDEAATFNGRGVLVELLKRGRWRALKREIDALAKERGLARGALFFREVVMFWAVAHAPDKLAQIAHRLRGKKPGSERLLLDTLVPDARPGPDDGSSLFMVGDGRENRWRLIHGPHIAHRAEVWAQIGARHGLAYAFPLLDRRVVEFALSLPSAFFLSGGFRRRPFRDAMQGVLPEKVRRRHQKYAPFPSRYIDLAEARDTFLARLTVLEADANVRGVLDVEQLRKLLARIPSADTVREDMARGDDPQGCDTLLAVSRALELAAYLQQHGPQDATLTASSAGGCPRTEVGVG